MLNSRAQQVMKCLVEQYIKDGQPVSSRTLSEDKSIAASPATIRNVMMCLEKQGLLRSPHTSAGRVPTESGYRLFIEQLMCPSCYQNDPIEPHHIADNALNRAQLCQRIAQALHQQSGLTTMVSLPRLSLAKVERVELVILGLERMLGIVMFSDGIVQHIQLGFDKTYDEACVLAAAGALNIALSGRTLWEGKRQLMALAPQTMPLVAELALTSLEQMFSALDTSMEDAILVGETELLDSEISCDVGELKRVLQTVSHKRDLLNLMQACQQSGEIHTYVGSESEIPALSSCAVITAPYAIGGRKVGALALVGPMRINYPQMIKNIDIQARELSLLLNRQS